MRSADFLTKYTEKGQDQNLTHILALPTGCATSVLREVELA